MDEEVVSELIQEDSFTKKIKKELQRYWNPTIAPNYCKSNEILEKNW
jgi:hypothetical protein